MEGRFTGFLDDREPARATDFGSLDKGLTCFLRKGYREDSRLGGSCGFFCNCSALPPGCERSQAVNGHSRAPVTLHVQTLVAGPTGLIVCGGRPGQPTWLRRDLSLGDTQPLLLCSLGDNRT